MFQKTRHIISSKMVTGMNMQLREYYCYYTEATEWSPICGGDDEA
jgi:hypothetical protein